jgi:hypothetical protein
MKLTLMNNLFSLVLLLSSVHVTAQYKLTDKQIVYGYNYLKSKAGFRNPNSVQYNSSTYSTYKFKKECFTWVRYDISSQNGFGGFVRNEIYVYFFNGKPFSFLESGDYPAFPAAANTDAAADYIINLATMDILGKPPLESKFCPEEKKKLEEAEIKRKKEEQRFLEEKEAEELKEKKEKEAREREIKKNIESLLIQKNAVQATIEYNKLDLSGLWNNENNSIYNRIENLRKSNLKELSELISAKKIDEAIVLYKLTGDDIEFLKKIKVLLAEKYSQPDHLMDQTSILSMIRLANIESSLQNLALEGKTPLTLLIHRDGQCELKHGNAIVNQFITPHTNVSKNIYKEIEFEVDAIYKLEIAASKEKSEKIGLKLSRGLNEKLLPNYNAVNGTKFYFSEKEGEKLLLYTPVNKQCSTEKFAPVNALKYLGLTDDLTKNEIEITHQCPLMINGDQFGKCTYSTRIQGIKLKKLK